MPRTVEDLAQQAGVSRLRLESLADEMRMGAGGLYRTFTVRKRGGGIRGIVQPLPPLDAISKNLNRSFEAARLYNAPDHVHGFIRGRSTLTNARPHLGSTCVLRIDLEDFFPTIRARTVAESLQAFGYDEAAAQLAVSCLTIANSLPIGLSTSPFLSNVAFGATDAALSAYADTEGLAFTRYADDLTFSGEVADRHLVEISQILDDNGWSVSTRKTAFMRRGGRQYVTGLYVGEPDRPRLPRALKRRMRAAQHIISKFGYEAYMAEFGGEAAGMTRNRLLGTACYMAAIEPDLGFPLLKELDRLIPEDDGPTHWY